MNEWLSVIALFVGVGVGTYTGWRLHQAWLVRTVRRLAKAMPAVPDHALDEEALYRVLKQRRPGEP